MSLSSKKTRKQLRRSWLIVIQSNATESGEQLSFADYKRSIDWQPAIQKGWDPARNKKAPHQQ